MFSLSKTPRRHAAAPLVTCAAIALALAACGGGNGGATAASSAQADAAETVSKDTDFGSSAATEWVACAAENQRCVFAGLHQVRYGVDSRVVVREMNGPIGCDNATFGDPAVGIVKSCAVARAGWTRCAAEGGRCDFEGSRTVRYGTLDRSATRLAEASVGCDNATFGDPAVGIVKTCWLLDAVPAGDTPPVASACDALPPLPAPPADALLVTSFCIDGRCARADDDLDDTDAIDRALDAATGRTLVFPPGRYLISRSLRVKRAGVTMWGPGATIHATNPDDQSIIVEANDVSIFSFRLTAVTAGRGSRAEHTRIAIYGPAGVNPVVRNTVIRGNQIVPTGEPGSSLANSATGAGIFVNAADGFLITGNTVVRSLADGIHLIGGARNGRVIGNTVRETGDDMIAVVSYAYPDPNRNTAATIAGDFGTARERYLDRDILIARNTLSGNYWGRGIAVVGASGITIRDNLLQNVPYGAAILIAREAQSGSHGTENVAIENNVIRDAQTLDPPYDVDRTFASHPRTGHGAVEIHATTFLDEMALPALRDGFAVRRIALRGNRIERAAVPGVRVGVGSGSNWTIGNRPATGSAEIVDVAIEGTTLADIRNDQPVQLFANASATCRGNVRDGGALALAACPDRMPAAAVTGASLSCGH